VLTISYSISVSVVGVLGLDELRSTTRTTDRRNF
jgi:hypothetical protein